MTTGEDRNKDRI